MAVIVIDYRRRTERRVRARELRQRRWRCVTVPRIAGDVTAGPWRCQLRAGERCAVRGKGAAFDLLRRG
jgi:hypothetical protein